VVKKCNIDHGKSRKVTGKEIIKRLFLVSRRRRFGISV
jgi:hypothetical protein